MVQFVGRGSPAAAEVSQQHMRVDTGLPGCPGHRPAGGGTRAARGCGAGRGREQGPGWAEWPRTTPVDAAFGSGPP